MSPLLLLAILASVLGIYWPANRSAAVERFVMAGLVLLVVIVIGTWVTGAIRTTSSAAILIAFAWLSALCVYLATSALMARHWSGPPRPFAPPTFGLLAADILLVAAAATVPFFIVNLGIGLLYFDPSSLDGTGAVVFLLLELLGATTLVIGLRRPARSRSQIVPLALAALLIVGPPALLGYGAWVASLFSGGPSTIEAV